jgi:molybdopterin/thiamine biosynthesis adenylyltransferase
MEVINRYGRQELIEGWDQNKLKNYNVALIGSGNIANFLSASLTALGVGNITLCDDNRAFFKEGEYRSREFLISNLGKGRSKVEGMESKLRKINPLINIYGLQMELDEVSQNFLKKQDLIVSCVNDVETITKYYEYASNNDISIYLAQGDERGAFFSTNYSDILDYSGKNQEPIVSEVIGGILAGEVLNKIMGKKTVDQFAYYPSKDRFNLEGVLNKTPIDFSSLKDKKALVIGAGALGNFLGIGLMYTDIGKIYLVDDDVIETTNLNRQILFYDKVGNNKADTLAERLNELNPNVDIETINKRVDEHFQKDIVKIKPDIIVDCVDNLATRAILNHFAIRYNIPLLSGGTDYRAGQVVVYEPGKSSCLNCRLNSDKALVEARTSNSCIHAPTPSVVISNHIIGGLMAAETRCVLNPQAYGEAIRKTIKYDSTKEVRAGLIGTDKNCECKRKISADKKNDKKE